MSQQLFKMHTLEENSFSCLINNIILSLEIEQNQYLAQTYYLFQAILH